MKRIRNTGYHYVQVLIYQEQVLAEAAVVAGTKVLHLFLSRCLCVNNLSNGIEKRKLFIFNELKVFFLYQQKRFYNMFFMRMNVLTYSIVT